LAGLKHNDRIVAVNGHKLHHFLTVTDVIQQNPNEKVTLKILRDQKEFEVSLKPEVPERIAEAPVPKQKQSNQKPAQSEEDKGPKLGITWNLTGDLSLVHPGPIEQIKLSVNSMISTFGALFSPKSDIKPQHLSGPSRSCRFIMCYLKAIRDGGRRFGSV
jgi:regulator of sigma E protease